MAVIREKRQFGIGRIGVARASQGGRILGESISRSANSIGDMLYRQAAVEAEKAGVAAAQSVAREKLITLNPQTGKPEAYDAPSGMGSIGTDAYQRVIVRRFQQSIEDEIKNKGAELSARYEDNANGAALYESAMSEYLASMSNVAQDEFKGFITDVGATYLNATRTNMGIAQLRRERSAAREAQAAAIADGLENIEAMVAQIGPSALNGPTVTNSIISSVSSTNVDGGNAGLFGGAEVDGFNVDTRLAITRGLIRNAATRVEDPDTLRLLQQAIGTQNPNAVPADFPEIADAIRDFGADFSALSKLEKFSDGLLSDQVQYAEIVQSREVKAQEAQDAQIVFAMQNNLAGKTLSAKGFAVSRGPLAVANRARDEWARLTQQAGEHLAAGNKDISDQTLKERDAILKAQATGLYARALSGLSTKDTDALENAIANRNPMLAPESARLELNALFRMEASTGQPVISDFMSEISSYRSSAGKNVDSIIQAAAAQEALKINLSSITFASNVDDAVSSAVSQINAINGLDSSDREAMTESALLNAGVNSLNSFFANPNLTGDQLREARSAFEGGAVQEGVLTQNQIDQVVKARSYADQANKLSQLRTTFNSQVGTVNDRITAREVAVERSRQRVSIGNGQASPTIKSNREAYEEMLSEAFAGGRDISGLWGDSELTQSSVARNLLNDITRNGIMPQSLHETLSSLAEGEFRIGSPNAVLSHYINLRDYQFEGQRMRNPAINSLPDDQIAMLDYLADVSDVEGNVSADRMAQLFQQKVEFDSKPAKKERVETVLGASLEDFVLGLDGIEAAPHSAFNALSSATLSLASMGASQRQIRKQLERQIEVTYPDGQGYVVNPNGGTRSKFSIGLTAYGHEKEFKRHVVNTVLKATTLTSVALGEDLTQSQRGFAAAENSIYLVPLDASSDGAVRYLVKRRRSFEDGGDEVINGTFSEGETVYTAPIIVSNRDPEFVNTVTESRQRKEADEIKRAKDAERFSGTGPGSFLGTVFGRDN